MYGGVGGRGREVPSYPDHNVARKNLTMTPAAEARHDESV